MEQLDLQLVKFVKQADKLSNEKISKLIKRSAARDFRIDKEKLEAERQAQKKKEREKRRGQKKKAGGKVGSILLPSTFSHEPHEGLTMSLDAETQEE